MIDPDDVWWNAIRDRDAAFDGALFYGVVTTGVYCRPGCPSRRPKRENVRFYPDATSAERAGLRPCKRCRPDNFAAGNDSAQLVIGACIQLISMDPLPKPSAMARLAGVSDRTLRRAFNELLGITPGQYLQALKSQRLRDGLRKGERVTDAFYSAGFSSSSRAYANTGRLGMQPSAYAAGGAGIRIEFVTRRTQLGWLLAASTERGLCWVRFGETRDALVVLFEEEFSGASRIETANEWIEALFDFADHRSEWRVLPIDVRGTAFQERVWQALREIPPGQVATYSDVAHAIGVPQSVRAVANACGANPVALAVPCHRVVPKSGGIGGYRWGTATKGRLLAIEQDG
ncbi:MAG: methylated-DNA--[protein]-cysteine S-methyltransferase [Proteobacteria bacterium]|nr:methylated-DNA--[protein]-cysteine S-methyltransferase [Pseudomonadota bacterium]